MALSVRKVARRNLLLFAAPGVLFAAGFVYVWMMLASTSDTWERHTDLSQPRPAAVSLLFQHLGYGGFVHNTTNALLRPGEGYIEATIEDIGKTKAAIEAFRALDLSPLEHTSLDLIEADIEGIATILAGIGATADSNPLATGSYDPVVRDVDEIAASAADLAEVVLVDRPATHSHETELAALYSALGLNGLIHHFKMLVLTGNEENAQKARQSGARALAALDRIEAHAEHSSEFKAINLLRLTIEQYLANIPRALKMHRDGVPVQEIDRAVRIADAPALTALATLRSYNGRRLLEASEVLESNLAQLKVAMPLLLAFACLPMLAFHLHLNLWIVKQARKWSKIIEQAGDMLATENYDATPDFAQMPDEFQPLHEAYANARRTLRQRRDQEVEAKAQVENLINEKSLLAADAAQLRSSLEEARTRAGRLTDQNENSRRTLELLGRVLGSISHGVFAVDEKSHFLFWNARMPELLAIPPDWFTTEREFWDLLLYLATRGDFGSGDPWEIASERRRDLETELETGFVKFDLPLVSDRVLEVLITRESDGSCICSAVDVTERFVATKAMEEQATSDPLTGLANRNALGTFVTTMVSHARRNGQKIGVLAIDLDGFKPINDRLGHAAGDEALVTVARRLQDEVRDTDCAARVGGDEFIIVLTNIEDAEGAEKFARRLLQSVASPIAISGEGDVTLSASIGIALYPDDGEELATIQRCADEALYEAKRGGRNQARIYRKPPGEAEGGDKPTAGERPSGSAAAAGKEEVKPAESGEKPDGEAENVHVADFRNRG